MTNLYFDVGNTRSKWLKVDGEGEESGVLNTSLEELEAGELLLIASSVSRVMVSSVKASERIQNFIDCVNRAWGVEPLIAMTQASQRGVVCSYDDPGRLGVDRWLAMLAAKDVSDGETVCVVDCGSAITIDVVLASGEHAGGYILPGLRLSIGALLEGTDSVIVDVDNLSAASGVLGKSTTDAVYNGALFNLKSLVEATVAQIDDENGEKGCLLVITGGDGRRLSQLICLESLYIENLVLEGLKLYFDIE